jgi:hypothetical protein
VTASPIILVFSATGDGLSLSSSAMHLSKQKEVRACVE